MECKKIQQWLLTDYLDHELDPGRSRELEEHLKVCQSCREFLGMVRKTVLMSLQKTEIQPDPMVWQKITEKIRIEKEYSRGWFEKLLGQWLPVLRISQPAFRLAFVIGLVVVVVALTSWPMHYPNAAYTYLEEQMGFLNELQAGNLDLFNGDMTDYYAVIRQISG